MDPIQVKNLGDKTLVLKFNSRETVIPAGESAVVDREAAIKDFGDWTRINVSPDRQYRTQEYERVLGMYGAHPSHPDGNHLGLWEANRPRVDLFERDGSRIVPIWEDPEGKGLRVEEMSSRGQAEAVEGMREQMELMASRLAEMEDRATLQELPPEDKPSAPRRRRNPEIEIPEATG